MERQEAKKLIGQGASLIAAYSDMLEALYIAADLQHDTSEQRGEIDCNDKTPCIFCAAIAKAREVYSL